MKNPDLGTNHAKLIRGYENFFESRAEQNEEAELNEETKFDINEGFPKFKRIMDAQEFTATLPNEIVFKRFNN